MQSLQLDALADELLALAHLHSQGLVAQAQQDVHRHQDQHQHCQYGEYSFSFVNHAFLAVESGLVFPIMRI
jgi:hypothetical protein